MKIKRSAGNANHQVAIILGLHLIGSIDDVTFLDQLQFEMRQNQYSPVLPLSPYHCTVTECTFFILLFFFRTRQIKARCILFEACLMLYKSTLGK